MLKTKPGFPRLLSAIATATVFIVSSLAFLAVVIQLFRVLGSRGNIRLQAFNQDYWLYLLFPNVAGDLTGFQNLLGLIDEKIGVKISITAGASL